MVNDERREDEINADDDMRPAFGGFGPEPGTPREGRIREPIDTENKFRVDSSATEIVVHHVPLGAITRKDAYLLAAWLVVHADEVDDGTTDASFPETLAAVLASTGHRVG
jgi:hypothetical protein